MEFVATYGKEIVALIVPFITWFLNVGIKTKAKLIWASPHSFTFIVPEPVRDSNGQVLQPNLKVCTASIKVINVGRDTAHKVELIFNWCPQYINLWPVRSYQQTTAPDGRHILTFENLSPKEELGLEVMSVNADLPQILVVRSAECMARNVPMMWVHHVAPWKINAARLLLFVGLGASVYGVIALLQVLVLKTPVVS